MKTIEENIEVDIETQRGRVFFFNTFLPVEHTEHYISWLQGNIA